MITLKQHSRMRGLFMIERQQHNPDGSPIPGTREVVAPWQDNLLLDSGLDNLGTSGWMTRCYIGSGSSAPSAEDTQLVSVLTSRTGSVSNGPDTEDYSAVTGSWVFPPGEGSGIIAELGVGPNSGNLTTRSLVRDAEGAPTTITKGPIDSLTVTYQIRDYPDKTDTLSQVENPHTSQMYDVVTRTFGGTAGRLGAWHSHGPTGGLNSTTRSCSAQSSGLLPWDSTSYAPTAGQSTDAYAPGYSLGSHYRDLVLIWNEGAGNIAGGIVSIKPRFPEGAARMQASFDPPIDKDNTKTLQITLRKSWGRYVP